MAPKKMVPQKSPQTKKGKKKVEPGRKAPRAQAPKKYRMLRHGEVIKKGDQYEWSAGDWEYAIGSIGERYEKGGHYPTRRPVKARGK